MLKLHNLSRLVRPPTPKQHIIGPRICVGLGTMDCRTFDEYPTGTDYVLLDTSGTINVGLYKGVHYGYSSPRLDAPDILVERLYAYPPGEKLFPFHSTYYSRDGMAPATLAHPDSIRTMRSLITGDSHREHALTPLQLQGMFAHRHTKLPDEIHGNVMHTTFEEDAFTQLGMFKYRAPSYVKPWSVDADIASRDGVVPVDLENRLWPYAPLMGNEYFSALGAQEYLDVSIDDALTEENIPHRGASLLHAIECLAPYEVDLRYILQNGEVALSSVVHLFNPYRTIVTLTITRSTLCESLPVALTHLCANLFGDKCASIVADIRVIRLLSEEAIVVIMHDNRRTVYYLDLAHMKMTAPGVVFIG